jgi:hypothetical protein
MCGRYRLSRRKQLVEEYFETALGMTTGTQNVAAISELLKPYQAKLMRWSGGHPCCLHEGC